MSEPKMCTTNGKPVEEVRASQTNETGQHDGYIVLCPDERAKGFVRPYRSAYRHVGRSEDIIVESSESTPIPNVIGQRRVGGCHTVTTMGRALSETYARDPKFYGATYCVGCRMHRPVAEFTWNEDGKVVGS